MEHTNLFKIYLIPRDTQLLTIKAKAV